MLGRLYSFKLIISVTLLWLTLLAYGLAFYSSRVYRDLAAENQLESLRMLLALETEEEIEALYARQKLFAFKLQNEKPFQSALEFRNQEQMEAWLAKSYQRYFVASGQLQLKSIIVRDLDGEIFAQVHDLSEKPYLGCPLTLSTINNPGSWQLKPRYALCSDQSTFYSEVLTPAGVLKPRAYVQIVAYAVEALKRLEGDMAMPLSITDIEGSVLYRSVAWPDQSRQNYLKPVYQLYGDDSILGVNISVAFDMQPFLTRLRLSEKKFLIVAALATLAILALVLVFLNRAFQPLNRLRNSAGVLLTGKYARINEHKLPSELTDLVLAYNEMVEGLESETISRRQVEEKLRSEKDFIATTLDSIANPVIVIDSKDRIKLVNPGAEKLFGAKLAKLLDDSIHEHLILYANRQTTRIVDISLLLTQEEPFNAMFFYDANRNLVELEFSASPMIDLEAEDVGFVIILKDVSEDRSLRRKLDYEGSHDQLTGFLNRAAFELKFERFVAEDYSVTPQHVLAYLDVDQFKLVNETCGSAAGDLLLKRLSTIIEGHLRKSDIVSRLGGDEFGFILPFVEMESAQQVLQGLIIDIQHSGFSWNDREFEMTASIGVMAFGQMYDDYADFYSKVTTACFLAKKNGGNQYLFIADDDEKVLAQKESMGWVARIIKGFAEERFCLYAQPIVAMGPRIKASHYELLIRYLNPDGSISLPIEFLPPAERYNLIEKIDRWVVTKAIGWLEQNQPELSGLMFSINLSGRSIGSENFHQFLLQSLQDTSIDLTNLCFEITETAAIGNVERSVEFISSVRQLGASFSLDDFGAGLSSFGYLKQFPVDYLKIDGAFIREILSDDRCFVFVRSMAEVGHCLDMKVIAEYVESDAMLSRLREADIDYIQGYAIGEPVAIATLLKQNQG